jgi:hypothetical protein
MRAIRRHHIARLKKKRAHYWGGHASSSPATLGAVVQTPHGCSCYACGNPRKHFKMPTRQEDPDRWAKMSWWHT